MYRFLHRLTCAFTKVHLSRLMGERRLKIADIERMTKEFGNGLHRNGITKLYNEKTEGIKFETLDVLCKVLGCTVADIIERLPDNEKETASQ
ncbi:helix-turn-helix transcriptional regulator [Paenibacillus sp. LHD-38]|uniref:helix-turn-helix domain-containing protein n=1 Tax=Paenibacillus sp. LHD-38 TaxID=3072143 RepID=UPI00280FD12B|nr:helix-turn-helix transcriptional regulator [Paenibacillus sp. LHD-38]MDQ8733199.1 helix-turn-helix transcriptional regulator [Paenibacillus sp. LHD-38]